MTPVSAPDLTKQDETRLRDLAHSVVRGIEDASVVLARLGFTSSDYMELAETRMFRQMLSEAQVEWDGAGNTHKRIKLKAAVNIEQALPHFYSAMTSDKEPLSSKVKAFEVVSRVAGLGNPEPLAAGNGQFFKLEINLGGGAAPMVLESGVQDAVIEHGAHGVTAQNWGPAVDRLAPSRLFDALPLEEL